MSRWARLIILIGTAFALTATSAAASTRSLGGNVEPALDPIAPGSVAVVASGAPERGVVPVIVQNATQHPVSRLRIRATALDGDGDVVARTTSRNVVPEVLEQDGLGLAQVDFRDPKLPLSVTYRFDVRARRATRSHAQTLEPTSFRLSPPTEGPRAQALDVTLRNPSDERLRGPLRVAVMCFGESGRPVRFVGKAEPRSRIDADASITTTIDFRELCPAYLVGGTATRAR